MDIRLQFYRSRGRAQSAETEHGGTLLTLTYQGLNSRGPSYNVMGWAKAAWRGATRYLAEDLGRKAFRVNAISPGR